MEEMERVPYALMEAENARHHKTYRLMVMAMVMVCFMMFCAFCAALYGYEEEIVTTTTEYSADSGDGGNAIVGDGDITIGYGEEDGYYDGNQENA